VSGTILITLPASIPIGPGAGELAGPDAGDDGGQQLFGGGEQVLSFVSLWAGILQAIDLLNQASGRETVGYYTMCYPLGLSGTRPLIRGKLSPAAKCPVPCRAAQSYAAPASRQS
jgi:hypothetical protein